MKAPVVIGITGGTGSGKTVLAHWLHQKLAPQALIFCQDWYYYGKSRVKPGKVLNFDHPQSINHRLMYKQLRQLIAGKSIEAPEYDYTIHEPFPHTHLVEPQPVILVEGIFTLYFKELFSCYDYSVFIDTPADIRLMRRLERDLEYRARPMPQTLQWYRDWIRPMHQRFIEPCKKKAHLVWNQMEDKNFPKHLLTSIQERMKQKPSIVKNSSKKE